MYNPFEWESDEERRRREAGLPPVEPEGFEPPEFPPFEPGLPTALPPEFPFPPMPFEPGLFGGMPIEPEPTEPRPPTWRDLGPMPGGIPIEPQLLPQPRFPPVEPGLDLGRIAEPLLETGRIMAEPGAFLDWLLNPPGLPGAGPVAERLPSPLREAVEVGTTPATLFTAGFSPEAAAALRGGPLAARIASRLIEPFVRGGFPARMAAETALGTAGLVGAEEVAERVPEEWPAVAQIGLPLAAGLAAGGGAIAGIKGLERAAPGVIRAGERLRPEVMRGLVEEAGGGPLPTSRAELMAENRRLKTLVQEGRATPEETARLDAVRTQLAGIGEAPPPPGGVPPGGGLGKIERMWQEGGPPPRDWGDLELKAEEWLNDIYSGLRRLQKRAGKLEAIEPGGERDLVTLLTRGPGVANAGATRFALTAREIRNAAEGIPVDDINTILFAKHGMEILAEKGPKRVLAGKLTAPELDNALAQLQARLGPTYRQAEAGAEVVQQLYKTERGRLVDEGFITADEAAVWDAKYPWYNPLRYVEFVEEETARGKAARPFSVVSKGVYRLSDKGSVAAAQRPLDALGEQLIRNEVRIQKNQTAKAIIQLAEETKVPGINKTVGIRPVAQVEGEVIFRPATGDIPGTLSYWEGGKRVIYEVPEWIDREATVLNRVLGNPVSSLIGSLNGISRAAFTTFSPPFVISNMLNDSLTAALTRGIMPPHTVGRLVASLRGLEGDKIMQSFRLAGGFQMRFYGRSAEAMAKDVGLSGGKVVGDNRSLRRAILDAIPRAGEVGEQAPRMALFQRELDKTLPAWKTMDAEAIARTPQARKAAADAVELTINFARGSYLIKAANPFVIFLNASMEGVKLPFRAIKNNPAARLRLAAAGAGTAGLTAYNLSYPEYFDIPNDIRWGSVVIMLPSKEKDSRGNPKPNYLTVIPRTREWGLFFGPVTFALEKLYKGNPTDFGTFARTIAPQLSPVSELPMPEVINELTEQIANYDFYFAGPIVPPEVETLSAKEQVTPWISPTIAKIARTVGVSPVRAQHMAFGVLGGAARSATSVADYIAQLVQPRQVLPSTQRLVEQYEALETPARRRAMLTGLSPDEREALEAELRQPKRGLPLISPIVQRVYPERGGQLYRTGEEVAARETGISPKQTRAVGKVLQDVSDLQLTEQQRSDTALQEKRIDGEQWRENRKEAGLKYQGALLSLGVQYPSAAQVQQDPALGDAYYKAVATLAGATPDMRTRGQILAAGWYSIHPQEIAPGEEDWRTFFTMRERYKATLSSGDRRLLEEEIASHSTPKEREYEADQERMRPYWEVGDGVWADALEMYPRLQELGTTYSEYKNTIKQWRGEFSAERMAEDRPAVTEAHIRKAIPEPTRGQLTKVERAIKAGREFLRKNDRELEMLLYKWGYVQRTLSLEPVGAR